MGSIMKFLQRLFRNEQKPQFSLEFIPRCALCARPAAEIQLSETSGGWLLIYSGPGGSSGSGIAISAEKANAIRAAFEPPCELRKIKAAKFYDDAGFCADCEKFYCPTHWNISPTGCGKCPAGHFKSLDPHWSPEW